MHTGDGNQAPHAWTVEAESAPGEVTDADDALDNYPDFFSRYGITDAAVVVTGEGQVLVCAQTEAINAYMALKNFVTASPWLSWEKVRIYRGVPE